MSDSKIPFEWKDVAANYGVSEKWGIGHWPYHPEPEPPCTHQWVDTGTLKSFCKKCNADGEWDSKSLQFKPKGG